VARARSIRQLALAALIAIGWVAGLAVALGQPQSGPGSEQPDIEIFVREGCPHCEEAKAFLGDLSRRRPALTVVVRDVSLEEGALDRLRTMAAARGSANVRVPAIFVGNQLIIGFSPEAGTGALIEEALSRVGGDGSLPPGVEAAPACAAESGLSCEAEPTPFQVTAFGRVIALDAVGLPTFTLAMGLLDGLNPCSMWVLVLMISLLAPLHDRRRMLLIAGTFVLLQGVAYFAFMAAWLNLFLLIGLSRASEVALGALAVIAGLINLKDFFAFRRGVSLSIPDSAKPGIYARMRRILHADSMAAALAATVVLSVLVQLVELLCTSGFPALFTRILTLRQMEGASYYGYLLLYDLAYMFDDVIVLAIGVITLSNRRLQEKEGRVLKLLSGLAMVVLGLYLVTGLGA
jgi:glutaredoxin